MCMSLFTGVIPGMRLIPSSDNKQTWDIKSPGFDSFAKTGLKTGTLRPEDRTVKEGAIVHNPILTVPRGVLMF